MVDGKFAFTFYQLHKKYHSLRITDEAKQALKGIGDYFLKKITHTFSHGFDTRTIQMPKYVDGVNFLYEVCRELAPIHYKLVGRGKKSSFHTFCQT